MVPPGRSFPSRSAASIIRIPIRSFTDPPGLSISSFASTVGRSPRVTARRRTSGVSPIASRNESSTCIVEGPLHVLRGTHRPTTPVLPSLPALPRPLQVGTVSCRCVGGASAPIGRGAAEDVRVDVSEVERGPDPGGEKLLVVDDDPFIARLLEIELAAAGYQVRVANDGEQAIQLVQQEAPDLVITDVMMPHVDGFELTRLLRQDPRTAAVSVIILTARGLSADKLEGFAIGADDYIVKPFDTPELLARVRGVLRRSKEMKDESPLTGLPGNVRIQEEIEDRVSSGNEFALLYADLDQFKAFNDHYGFARGDQVIQELARTMENVLEELVPGDAFVGHLGGDDFVLVVPPSAGALVADAIVQRCDDRSPEYYDAADRERGWIEVLNRRGEQQRFPPLTISIGIASTQRRRFAHFAEVVAVATEMKNFTKSTPGSSWAIDRRTT